VHRPKLEPELGVGALVLLHFVQRSVLEWVRSCKSPVVVGRNFHWCVCVMMSPNSSRRGELVGSHPASLNMHAWVTITVMMDEDGFHIPFLPGTHPGSAPCICL